MSVQGNLLRPAVVGLASLLATACQRDDSSAVPPPPPSASVAPDRLEPNELAEGTELAFKLKLPRGMEIRFKGPFEIQAEGPFQAERVANYVRKRMKSDGVEVGAARTIFNRARLRNDDQAPVCQVEVVSLGNKTRLVIRDLTPEKVDPSIAPDDRWRSHGLDPNGRLLDPSHME